MTAIGDERPSAPSSPVVLDDRPARIRRSLDLVRLTGLLIILALLGLAGSVGSTTSRAADGDLARLFNGAPALLARGLSVAGAIAVFSVPLAFLVKEIVQGQTRRLIEALLTGVLAIGVIRGLDLIVMAFPHSALYHSLMLTTGKGSARPFDAYLAALLALITMTEVVHDLPWRRLFLGATGLYVVSAFAGTQASLLSLLSSPVIGLTVAMVVRYLAGSVNDRPDGYRIAAALARRGLPVTVLERQPISPPEDHRSYQGTTEDGTPITVQVFDRDLVASGVFYSIYRVIRVRSDITPAPALSLDRLAERRSLLAMSATAAGVRIPRLLAGTNCGPDAFVLVYQRLAGTPLDALPEPISDEVMAQLWQDVSRLHRNGVTHRGLNASQILLDPQGRVVLPIPEDGAAFASDLRINLDRAQLLITTAALAGPERAVRVARQNLGDGVLVSILPILQPIVLPRETRLGLKDSNGLLDAVREEIGGQTHQPPPELERVERVRPRTVVTIVAVLVAVYLLVGQLGSVDLRTVFATARWRWVPLLAAASAATYVAAALSLTGFVRERLSFARTVLAQLAASFTGFVTPPAVGGLAVNIRYLQKAGVSTTGAATSVGMSQVVNAVSHVLLLIGFAAATGVSAHHRLPVPGWAFVALGGIAAVVLGILAVPEARRWLLAKLLPPLREALPRLLNLFTRPVKLSQAVAGTLMLNLAYISALWFAVHAFSGDVPFAAVAVVYLTGAAIASAAPTPGGLGALEIALSTGLAAAGMASAAAISAVLLYRVATFWLPVPIGWAALQVLRRRDAI
jgi:uncharacterized membrane protein YbhN (UPF0104 family)